MKNILYISFCIFLLLIIRLAVIQLLQGGKLQEMVYEQQTLERAINPRRGTIYDRTGEYILAISATCETVTVNPGNIPKEKKEIVAQKLVEIFELDYEKTLKKVSKRISIETIARKVEKEKTDELRIWMKQNDITTGINIDEDTKRYYPNNNLGAQIIGFCGSDNQGLDGIEAKYEEILKGKKGAIKRHTDAKGREIGSEGEIYVSAIDGDDLILTIDFTIQSIIEKYLKEACIDNVCTDGGNIVAMDPKTGDILGMATYPDYNLNKPFESDASLWRNKAVSDSYEPGSTFKIVTAAAAIEEGITDSDNKGEFGCGGGIEVAGVRIKCWRHYKPHGAQSLREGLMNSCNPVFIGLGQKLRS